jgi:hypothetical protein
MQREQLHHRAHADRLRHLRGGGDEQLLRRRHAEIGAVVLSQVVPTEPGLVSHAHQVQAVL